MKLPRRKFLHLAASAAALPSLPRVASALDFPTRPVRWVVGLPPGGGTDTIARLLGQWLSERVGQPFVIENRPGANSNIATESVVRAAADGYTLLTLTASGPINATLYDKLNFDFIRDIAPVACTVRAPLVLEVNPSLPARTVPEFIAHAKANPGKITVASFGVGSISHVAGELFKMKTGVDTLHVPYKGTAPALTDLLAGQVHAMFADMTTVGYVKVGKLRALGVTTATRSAVLPDVPVIGDFVAGYELISWQGVGAPRNTPADVIDKLNSEINAAQNDPKILARLSELGYAAFSCSPGEFRKFIAEEAEKWARVIRFANIKAE